MSGHILPRCIRCFVWVNCVGTWSGYGPCSSTCGSGSQSRTFSVTTAASNGGSACEYSHGSTQIQSCNNPACPGNKITSAKIKNEAKNHNEKVISFFFSKFQPKFFWFFYIWSSSVVGTVLQLEVFLKFFLRQVFFKVFFTAGFF